MRATYDIIISGCGPAGATCAGRASELGLSVLVLERSVFPRSKPCAGGLTEGAIRLLGDDVECLTHDVAMALRIASGSVGVRWSTGAPLVRTTTRSELDTLLAERASEAGARIRFGVALRGVRSFADSVSVVTGDGEFTGRYLVGADGPRSAVAAAVGYGRQPLCGGAYVRSFPAEQRSLERFKGAVHFHPSATSRGYGWIFPKRDHLNIGIYSQLPLGGERLDDLSAYVSFLGVGSWRHEGPYAAPIPAGPRRATLGKGRVLLVGDAAGLADPITGEGISYAMSSGRLAAESIAEVLLDGGGDTGRAARSYDRRLRADVMPALRRLRRVGNLLYSLGPRGIERAIACPPARFAIRRLGWWRGPQGSGGELTVESDRHQQ